MARAKKCEEEFNPWPPFVDVFSSVILVLLLFVLVMIVNVAYYMQFNSKITSTSSEKSTINNLQKGVDPTQLVTLKKNIIQVEAKTSNNSMFKGGKAEGNSMSSTKDEKKFEQKVVSSSGSMLVAYDDKELFVNASTKTKIKSFAKKYKNKKIVLEIANSTKIISKTIAKQISLSRIVSIKNILKKSGINLSNIKIKLSNRVSKEYPAGYVKILTLNK
jgi:hypothetical protein